MTLRESICRYSVRKTLRFEIEPVGSTAERLNDLIAADEARAAALYAVKDALAAEHYACIRRVFASLPDPLPGAAAINGAFRADSAFPTLSGRSAQRALQLVIDRYVYNRWPIPAPLRTIGPWQGLFIKWHWHLAARFKGTSGWAGRAKAEIAATSPLLAPPRPHRASHGYWYDHAPFRLMFDNHSCGMSWLREDFPLVHDFLAIDDDGRIYVGVVPREASFNPFALPPPAQTERPMRLYVETAGQRPTFKEIAEAALRQAVDRCELLLFELVGRGLRGHTNLNQLYLRALFSPENLAEGAIHLDKTCEFFARKGMNLPLDDKPAHFRQRYLDDRFFLSLHVTFNPELVALGTYHRPFGNLLKALKAHPQAPCLEVRAVPGGYRAGESLFSAKQAANGALAGMLAKWTVEHDGLVVFARNVPKRLLEAVTEKFAYVVVRGVPNIQPGSALRGYQLVDRLLTGDLASAQALMARRSQEAANRAASAAARKEPAAKPGAEEPRPTATRRELIAKVAGAEADTLFAAPLFQTGKYAFTFNYKTPDNARHECTCRADGKDEVFQKLRTVGVRPYRVTAIDAAGAAESVLPPTTEGSKVFHYTYNDHTNAIRTGTLRADTRDEAYAKLRREGIRAASMTEVAVAPQTETAASISAADRLKRLTALKDQGLITASEYSEQRAKIIAEL